MAFVEAQKVQALIPEADKVQTVAAGATQTFGPWATRGYAQLVAAIRSSKAGTVVVEGNVLPGTGNWETLDSKVLVAATYYETVVDMTYDFVRIRYTDPGAPGDSDIEINANLWPIAALESNRSSDVEIKLGDNGATGEGLAGDVQSIAVPANPDRKKVTIHNFGKVNRMYFGYDAGITAADAFPIDPGQSYTIDGTTAAIHVITEAGLTTPFRWEEQRK